MPEIANEISLEYFNTTNLRVCFIQFLGGITFGAVTLFWLVWGGFVLGNVTGLVGSEIDVPTLVAGSRSPWYL